MVTHISDRLNALIGLGVPIIESEWSVERYADRLDPNNWRLFERFDDGDGFEYTGESDVFIYNEGDKGFLVVGFTFFKIIF